MKRQLMAALAAATFIFAASGRAADNPKPLPEKVVKAWGQAGATVGWMSLNQWGQLEFHQGPIGQVGAVAAFRVQHCDPEMLAKLPAPNQPFGLTFFARNTGQQQGILDAGSNVTDAGLKELARFEQLHSLCTVAAEQITEAGLKELAALKQLQCLDIRNSHHLTGVGLKPLAGLKQLRTLSVTSGEFTDAGVKAVAGLQQLQTLFLSGSKVTDAGMKELARMQQLRNLCLSSFKITDDGLQELAALKQLRTLYLVVVPISGAGLENLHRALPQLRINPW
jgi:hypothetical protein